MKKNTPLIARIASITGLLLGAFALSAIAGTWTAAPCSPPGCNTSAPINVGNDYQTKSGGLAADSFTALHGVDITGPSVFRNSIKIGGSNPSTPYSLDVDVGGFGTAIFGGLTTGVLQVRGSNYDKDGYVLTSNGNGVAEWQPANSSGAAIPGTTIVAGYEMSNPAGGYVVSHCVVIYGTATSAICDNSASTDRTINCPANTQKFYTGGPIGKPAITNTAIYNAFSAYNGSGGTIPHQQDVFSSVACIQNPS